MFYTFIPVMHIAQHLGILESQYTYYRTLRNNKKGNWEQVLDIREVYKGF
jgi:hypothetical protein